MRQQDSLLLGGSSGLQRKRSLCRALAEPNMRAWLNILPLLCLGGSVQVSTEDVHLARDRLLWLLGITSPCHLLSSVTAEPWGGLGGSEPGSGDLHWRRWDKTCPCGNAVLEDLSLISLRSFCSLHPTEHPKLLANFSTEARRGSLPSMRSLSKTQCVSSWMATCSSTFLCFLGAGRHKVRTSMCPWRFALLPSCSRVVKPAAFCPEHLS